LAFRLRSFGSLSRAYLGEALLQGKILLGLNTLLYTHYPITSWQGDPTELLIYWVEHFLHGDRRVVAWVYFREGREGDA